MNNNIIRKYKLQLLNYNTLTEKELLDLNIIFEEIKYCKENFEIIEYIYNNFFNLIERKSISNDIYYYNNVNDCKLSINTSKQVLLLKSNLMFFDKYSQSKLICILEKVYNFENYKLVIL